jgi:hypothetical protein
MYSLVRHKSKCLPHVFQYSNLNILSIIQIVFSDINVFSLSVANGTELYQTLNVQYALYHKMKANLFHPIKEANFNLAISIAQL